MLILNYVFGGEWFSNCQKNLARHQFDNLNEVSSFDVQTGQKRSLLILVTRPFQFLLTCQSHLTNLKTDVSQKFGALDFTPCFSKQLRNFQGIFRVPQKQPSTLNNMFQHEWTGIFWLFSVKLPSSIWLNYVNSLTIFVYLSLNWVNWLCIEFLPKRRPILGGFAPQEMDIFMVLPRAVLLFSWCSSAPGRKRDSGTGSSDMWCPSYLYASRSFLLRLTSYRLWGPGSTCAGGWPRNNKKLCEPLRTKHPGAGIEDL